jgi:hypothetical protein
MELGTDGKGDRPWLAATLANRPKGKPPDSHSATSRLARLILRKRRKSPILKTEEFFKDIRMGDKLEAYSYCQEEFSIFLK